MPRHCLVIATRSLPTALASRVAAAFDTRMPGEQPVRTWLPVASQGAAALLCIPGLRLDSALIAALAPSIRVIGTFSVGVDHIDVAAAKARGIAVVNTPGVLSQSTAEFTMLLLLAAARRSSAGERLVRAGRWQGAAPAEFLGLDVSGKRLGIFGMGRIGQALARIACNGFGMEVHYHNRSRLPGPAEGGAIYHADEDSFLAASQMLCLMAPGGATTAGWLNAERLRKLPPGAVVVNSARGTLVDDDALVAALRSGHVAAAALDVFPREPAVPGAYLELENVVLTPHIATATVETREAMGRLVLNGIEECLAGRQPLNLVS